MGGTSESKDTGLNREKIVSSNTLRRLYVQFYLLLEYHTFQSWRGLPLEFNITATNPIYQQGYPSSLASLLQFSYYKLYLYMCN